jgi:hypothetical protein
LGKWITRSVILEPMTENNTLSFKSADEGSWIIDDIKLEEGQTATVWTAHPDDELYYTNYLNQLNKAENINNYNNALSFAYIQSYFNSETAFNKLTAGGTKKGIFSDNN